MIAALAAALGRPVCTEGQLLELQHLILSHHGQLEFGSPVQPMTAEATAGKFTIVSECHRLRYEMSQQGNIVKFIPVPGSDCARFKSPAEQLAEKGVGLANIAMFGDDGRTVQLSGPGGTVSMSRR